MDSMASGFDSGKDVPVDFKFATPEVAFESDYEGDLHHKSGVLQCDKDPEHQGFIPVKELNKEMLPQQYADNDIIEMIKGLADLTVRIRVKAISEARPSTFAETNIPYPFHIPGGGKMSRAGSGFVNLGSLDHGQGTIRFCEGGPVGDSGDIRFCDCYDCKLSSSPKANWWEIPIITALHVIYDKKECKDAIVDFFYEDDKDKKGVVSLRGYQAGYPHLVSFDQAVIVCRTHKESLVNRIESTWRHLYYHVLERIQWKYGYKTPGPELPQLPVFVISHPHGCRKYVTVGMTTQDWMQQGCVSYTTKTCPGSSGGLVCLFGGELMYTFSPHAHALSSGHNQSGLGASARRNPRFW